MALLVQMDVVVFGKSNNFTRNFTKNMDESFNITDLEVIAIIICLKLLGSSLRVKEVLCSVTIWLRVK